MTRRAIFLAVAVAGLASTPGQAMPVAHAPTMLGAAILPIRDGCGPFGHRSHYGFCKPNGYDEGGPGYDRPAFYGPRPSYGRRCFVRETYDGPRRFCTE